MTSFILRKILLKLDQNLYIFKLFNFYIQMLK